LAFVLLDDNSNAPGKLLAFGIAGTPASNAIYLSNSASMPGAGRWVGTGLNYETAAATDYWICVQGSTNVFDIAKDGSGSDQTFVASTFLATGAYPSAWTITTTSDDYSIRALMLT